MALLRAEHELLGALFAHDDELDFDYPSLYGLLEEELDALERGVALADLSGLFSLLVAGPDAPALVQAACAHRPLELGECAFSAVLTGDASLAAIPLVARTGETEHLLLDLSPRAALLDAWLHFLASIEQDGHAPFANAQLSDVSDALVPLLIAGPQARGVLMDYTPQAPVEGEVASIMLDQIRCLVVGLPKPLAPGWLVFVPAAWARVLWRSFLSFSAVVPAGREALRVWAARRLPWWQLVNTAEHLGVREEELTSWGLARPEGGYVGHCALHAS
jgi:aminomethyltransferase